jgi:maltose phosphorylase
MKNYIRHHEWKVIEDSFDPALNRVSESLFSIGNGWMGQRANFEEDYSGDTLQGNYVAGVYYPDKTRVGWWKNGYPEYFAKVLNAANWVGIRFTFEDEKLDLAASTVQEFRRELNMQTGLLTRSFHLKLKSGAEFKVLAQRFCSMARGEVGALKYIISSVNFEGKCTIEPYIDFDVMNEDSNYDEKFWDEVEVAGSGMEAMVIAKTKKLDFHVAAGMMFSVLKNGQRQDLTVSSNRKAKYMGQVVQLDLQKGDELAIHKTAAILSSENHAISNLKPNCQQVYREAHGEGFDQLFEAHKKVWQNIWEHADVKIEGDVSAQQGIRFNIFQLFQTYTGHDERLNIGPKGFTGEKYGGSTYWDTEAYCLPFYLSTAEQSISRNLLIYRYKHLDKAIENAGKLGFSNGAALYPMVTMNGEECHNEWEITFEEIHRNGAIAYAIHDYIRYTGDKNYLKEYGLEVLIAIARFWSQRVNYSEDKKQFVMLGVTGPNEYENNVNNNWYTNTIAVWCMNYTGESIQWVKDNHAADWARIQQKTNFKEEEMANWQNIANNMYFPASEEKGIFLQQDGYLDKEQILVKDLEERHQPINQNWSWDRILRSCFIKQADVLQGLYFFENEFDKETIRRNFDFYEPRTVHESSLSPCVHTILAAKLGYEEKAYDLYLRTARLDLDDYNNDTEDGCHITSMAGSWMSIVKGFAGMRVEDGYVHFSPFVPKVWEGYRFKITFRGQLFELQVSRSKLSIVNHSKEKLEIKLFKQSVVVPAGETHISEIEGATA